MNIFIHSLVFYHFRIAITTIFYFSFYNIYILYILLTNQFKITVIHEIQKNAPHKAGRTNSILADMSCRRHETIFSAQLR